MSVRTKQTTHRKCLIQIEETKPFRRLKQSELFGAKITRHCHGFSTTTRKRLRKTEGLNISEEEQNNKDSSEQDQQHIVSA